MLITPFIATTLLITGSLAVDTLPHNVATCKAREIHGNAVAETPGSLPGDDAPPWVDCLDAPHPQFCSFCCTDWSLDCEADCEDHDVNCRGDCIREEFKCVHSCFGT